MLQPFETAFVDELYDGLLGRGPDAAGLAFWVDQLRRGTGLHVVATSLWRSAEHRGRQVDEFYQRLLERPADGGGRAFWVQNLQSGATEVDVQRGLLLSTEYQAAHATNRSFVQGLYLVLMGRPADAPGLSFWEGNLNTGGSRAQVVFDLTVAAESYRRTVDEFYRRFLDRPVDPPGADAWVSLLKGLPAAMESFALSVLTSPEFQNRLRGLLGP